MRELQLSCVCQWASRGLASPQSLDLNVGSCWQRMEQMAVGIQTRPLTFKKPAELLLKPLERKYQEARLNSHSEQRLSNSKKKCRKPAYCIYVCTFSHIKKGGVHIVCMHAITLWTHLYSVDASRESRRDKHVTLAALAANPKCMLVLLLLLEH